MKTLTTAVENSLGDGAAYDPAYAEALPYASLSVRLPNLKRALLILGKVEGDRFFWHSADRGLLETRHGRLTQTVGFASNLLATRFPVRDFLDPAEPLVSGARYKRQIDMSPGHHFDVAIDSTLYLAGEEDRVVANRKMRLLRLDEVVSMSGFRETFVNRFWVDRQRFVWRSEQQPIPGAPSFLIEVVKPYG